MAIIIDIRGREISLEHAREVLGQELPAHELPDAVAALLNAVAICDGNPVITTPSGNQAGGTARFIEPGFLVTSDNLGGVR